MNPHNFSLDWNDPARPFGDRLFRAMGYLAFKAKQANALEACETIGKIISEAQKHRLFQKFFPAEWAKSRTSLFKTGDYENYSERINEFFGLVNDHLFPLLSGWNDDPETDFEYFGIFSLNFDLCCSEIEYDHMRPVYLAGLLFFIEDEELWEHLALNWKINPRDFPEIQSRPCAGFWELEKTEETEAFLQLFELIDHSTGNHWLDTTNCCQYGQSYEWSDDTINFLAGEFQEAQSILKQMATLDELFEQNPGRVLSNLVSLWNDGKTLPEKE